MHIDQSLFKKIVRQHISDSVKLSWIAIKLEEYERDGFTYIDQKTWEEKYGTSIPTFQKHLKILDDQYLLERDYRSDYTGGKKLYVKPIEPETLDNMTFFAKFDEIEEETHRFGATKKARFSDVHNINQTICINSTWLDLKPEDGNSNTLERLNVEKGDYLCFKARVTKTEKGYFLTNIHNIRRSHEYYDNR